MRWLEMPLKSRRVGATGRAYNARGVGHKIAANVAEHGYKLKLQVELDYAAMTDKQGQKAHKLIYEALTEALTCAANMRAIAVPLFDLEDVLPKPGVGEGINER